MACSNELSRPAALALLEEWVRSESLQRHSLAVEAAMREQARQRGGDEELWGLTGLLHDLDYERYPDPASGHPRMALAELERRGYPPELIRGVASHADYLGVSRESEMERALAAVDELSGFVLACAYVRPEGIAGMTPRSVRKKLRQPSFAAAVDRDAIARDARELGVDLDELIESVIAALAPNAEQLGLPVAARSLTPALLSPSHAQTAVALLLAFTSTTLVSFAYVQEQAAVSVLPSLSLARPIASLRLLLSSRAWLIGFAMESGGFAMYVAALALAPIALVQSVAAGGIGVLAFASARMAHRRLTRRERLGAAVSVLGLLFLSLSLIGGSDHSAPGSLAKIALWLGCTAAAAALVASAGRALVGAAAADGIAGGLLFSCGDISTKVATEGGARIAFGAVAIAGYVLGTSLLQIGYQRGAALTIAGIATLLTNALPIAAGPVLFEETLHHGSARALRIIAFATVVAGAALLARPQTSAVHAREDG